MMNLMLKAALMAAVFVSVAPVLAQDGHEHEHEHEVTAGEITVVHPWARAAKAGGDSVVFMEFANGGEPDILQSATSVVADSVSIVGMTLVNGEAGHQDVGAIEISSGDFDFDPNGLGLLLSGLKADLVQGEDLELVLKFEHAGEVTVHVEIEAADASQHSHAGHSH